MIIKWENKWALNNTQSYVHIIIISFLNMGSMVAHWYVMFVAPYKKNHPYTLWMRLMCDTHYSWAYVCSMCAGLWNRTYTLRETKMHPKANLELVCKKSCFNPRWFTCGRMTVGWTSPWVTRLTPPLLMNMATTTTSTPTTSLKPGMYFKQF